MRCNLYVTEAGDVQSDSVEPPLEQECDVGTTKCITHTSQDSAWGGCLSDENRDCDDIGELEGYTCSSCDTNLCNPFYNITLEDNGDTVDAPVVTDENGSTPTAPLRCNLYVTEMEDVENDSVDPLIEQECDAGTTNCITHTTPDSSYGGCVNSENADCEDFEERKGYTCTSCNTDLCNPFYDFIAEVSNADDADTTSVADGSDEDVDVDEVVSPAVSDETEEDVDNEDTTAVGGSASLSSHAEAINLKIGAVLLLSALLVPFC